MGLLAGRLLPPQSPGTEPPHALVPGDMGESHSASSTCNCSSTIWHVKLSLPQNSSGSAFTINSPKASGACLTVVTGQEGCNTFSQPGNQFGGASIFTCFSCGTWGMVDSSRGHPMEATSSMATSLDGTLVETGGVSLETEVWLLKNPSSRATLPKMISSEKETYCFLRLT